MRLKGDQPVLLSTKMLDENLEHCLASNGIKLIQKDFVTFSISYNKTEFATRLNDPDTQARIFTTKGSIRSLKDLLANDTIKLIPKKTFTVGIKVTEMLHQMGIEVAAKSTNALSLAQIIARNAELKAVDFFCGTQTLNDLPEYLKTKGISVNRTEVFDINMSSEKLSMENIDAIMFFSPSAVYSFFSANQPDLTTPIFCIGAATAEAVHYRCNNPKVLADEPTAYSLINKVTTHFVNT